MYSFFAPRSSPSLLVSSAVHELYEYSLVCPTWVILLRYLETHVHTSSNSPLTLLSFILAPGQSHEIHNTVIWLFCPPPPSICVPEESFPVRTFSREHGLAPIGSIRLSGLTRNMQARNASLDWTVRTVVKRPSCQRSREPKPVLTPVVVAGSWGFASRISDQMQKRASQIGMRWLFRPYSPGSVEGCPQMHVSCPPGW